MSGNLYVATSGAAARLTELEIVANNVANADTVGFKADQAIFQAALESALLDGQGGFVPGSPARSFVATGDVRTHHGEGPISNTGAPLDAAIEGPGFFVVQTPEGIRYTRSGSFRVDAESTLTTPEGHPVLGLGGPIQVRPGARILTDGNVVDATGAVLGSLSVEEFLEPSLLVKEGDNLFRAPALAVGIPVEQASLQTSALERSNVNPVRELASMVMLQRAFDASMQLIEAEDAASRRLIQEVGS